MTRLRAEQFRPYFEQQAITLDLWTFLAGTDLDQLYEAGYATRVRILARGLVRTLALPRSIFRCDMVIVLREAIPFRFSLVERLAARVRPLIWDVDDAIWQPYRSHFFPWMAPWMRKSPRKFERMCSAATQVWAASEELASWCRNHTLAVRVVPTVVHVPEQLADRPTDDLVGWIGAPSTGGFLSSILPAVRQVQPLPHLLAVGTTLPECPGLPVETVRWSPEAEEDALARMRVGVYPIDLDHPLAEGKAGLKAILYMSRGIPPVVTPTRTNSLIVRPEIDGLHAGSLDEWIVQIGRLLTDRELWERCSRSAHARARSDYSTQVWGPRVVGYVGKVLVGDRAVPQPARIRAAEPLVSVVMPVFNAAEHLSESIESILGQTFSDFEFLILDDGSTDGSLALLREWENRDPRIKVFESPVNLGVVASSNSIVSRASTPFIARMDADDVAHPDRLRRQFRILQDETGVKLVGTLWDGIDSEGRPVRPRDRWRLAFRSKQAPFPHGSVMFRRESFDDIGGYRTECAYWEDLDLYIRMQGRGRVVAIPDTLYHYRFHANSARAVTPPDHLISSIALMRRCHAAYVSGGSYESVLAEHRPAEGERVPAAVLNSITSAHLWAGRPPGALRLLLRRGDLAWNRSTLAAVVMAAWGAASPRSLRFFLRRLIEARDLAAGPRLRKKSIVDWHSR